MYQNKRTRLLGECLPHIASALSQGTNVAVHCCNSFHRGPVGLVAILKALFGFEPRQALRHIGRSRHIYAPYYRSDDKEIPHDLGRAVAWAKGLSLWDPPKPKARPIAAPGGASSSQDGPPSVSLAEADRKLVEDRGDFLYRAMAQDRSDLTTPDPAWSQGLRGTALVKAIFDAVKKGSTQRSPFLHFSWDFVQARNWWMRGRHDRGEQHGYMARVSVKALRKLALEADSSQGGAALSQGDELVATTGKLIDLSDGRTFSRTFGKFYLDDEVQERLPILSICVSHKEVLVPFRGTIPEDIFELINEDTGLSKGWLVDRVARVMRYPRACEFPLPNKRAHFK